MTIAIRRLSFADAEHARTLSIEAFGVPSAPLSPLVEAEWPPAGMTMWGAVDGDRILGKVVVRDYESWFAGRRVPTAGIAGVTVAAEERGRGLLAELMETALADARTRGAVISTLYPTAPGIYRGLGYELVADLERLHIPMADLAEVRRPDGVTLRRVTAATAEADAQSIRAVYARWAGAQHGPLTRDGVSFPATAAELVAAFTGITMAIEDGEVTGYASWNRGSGYDGTGLVDVEDLVALTPGAAAGLLGFFSGFASVAAGIDLETSGVDPVLFALPGRRWRRHSRQQYMLRVLDLPAAIAARDLAAVDEEIGLAVDGGGLDGGYVLKPESDAVTCVAAPAPDGPRMTAQGVALLYAGTQSTANLRHAGHLTGPDLHDRRLDALFGGRQFHIRDYF